MNSERESRGEVFSILARRCRRCGGLLTSAQGLRDGCGPCCLKKERSEQRRWQEAQGQLSFWQQGDGHEA